MNDEKKKQDNQDKPQDNQEKPQVIAILYEGYSMRTNKSPNRVYGSQQTKSLTIPGLYFEFTESEYKEYTNSDTKAISFTKTNGEYVKFNFDDRTPDVTDEYKLKSITIGNLYKHNDTIVENGQITFFYSNWSKTHFPEVLSISNNPIKLGDQAINNQFDCVINYTTLTITLK